MATLTLERSADERTYQRRIRAWTLYDWANSAFVTTVMAALLPVYYSQVAGANLPSEATATAYWSMSLSIALLISAILSPILGTISDVQRGKKKLLALFIGFGVVTTGLLVFISTGDWFLASLLFILGRIGFSGAEVFYEALLPHVAKKDDLDAVSTRGYAMGYLGGGILLAINIVMAQTIPDSWFDYAGVRLSFLSVGVWWAVFSIPVLRNVPEPPAATARLQKGESVIGVSFRRLRETFHEIRQYRELFKYLVAFLLYNDAINTIIGVAAIYGAELGFDTLELVLALLLVQFVGIPFSLIFGGLPAQSGRPRRHTSLAFIVFNLLVLPLVAIAGVLALADDVTGNQPPPYTTNNGFYGEGEYLVTDPALTAVGDWETVVIPGESLTGTGIWGKIAAWFTGAPDDAAYAVRAIADSRYEAAINGQEIVLTYAEGPDCGILAVVVDGQPLLESDDDTEKPFTLDLYHETMRYNVRETITLPEPGQHTVSFINTGRRNGDSTGTVIGLAQVEVLPPARESNLPLIIVLLLGLQGIGMVFARLAGDFFRPAADALDTRRCILLALLVYCVIAVWGYFLNSTIEFWFLAWMVAIVQGGSQALSRSLYATLSPAAKSGEFFGLYSIMGKMAAITGPLIFAVVAATFDNSRPAILSLVALFVVGGYLLTRVDIEAGQRHAREEDARWLETGKG